MSKVLESRFLSKSENLADIRARVRGALENTGIADDETNCLVLAVNEACMNIIQHAYGDTRVGEIIIEIFLNNKTMTFRITDFAPAVDISSIKSRDLDDIRPGGLGVHLIHEVMDEVDFRNDPEGIGNILVMKKHL